VSDEKKIYPEGSGEFGAPDSGRPGKVEFDKDDLTSHTKATLKDYLSGLTHGKKNAFPISHASLIDPKTKEKKSLDDEIDTRANSEDRIAEIRVDTNDSQFVSLSRDSQEANAMRTYSDSGKFTDIEDKSSTLKTFFDKNKRGPGHSLLRDIKPTKKYDNGELTDPTGVDKEIYKIPDDAPTVQKRISAILTNNNRFSPSPESPYIRDGQYTKPGAAYGSIQKSLGMYTSNSPAGDLAINDLRKIAHSLMLKQTGHSGPDGNPDSENFITVAPGSFVDTRVPIRDTYASHAHKGSGRRGRPSLDAVVQDEDDDDHFFKFNDGKSYGATNSHLEPFTGNPLAAVTFILQGLITLFGLSFVIGIFLEQLFKEFTDERAQGKDPGSLPLGKSTDAPAAALIDIGVPYLRFPVFTCIAYGLAAFFRMKWPKARPDDDLGNFISLGLWFAGEAINIFEFIDRINESKGFYVNLMRNIMRDNSKIIDTFTDPLLVLGAIGEAALLGGSIKAVLVKLLSLFSGLSSFRFFMAVAIVGERCKMGEIRDFSGLGGQLIETIQDNGATRVTKSRVHKTSNALVWRHRSAPAKMILPVELLNAKGIVNNGPDIMTAVAAKVGDYEGTESHRRRIDFVDNGRISSDDVLKFEDELESEYMPFYFHDLRTNEVISFHAFITDMKDSFSVSYTDTDAYGRIDPVKIYNKTARSISVGFWLIATSQEDFDSMWLSINKLTNMVYPQWSEGRQLASEGKSFIMPFSQIPTASPMIRLRVGDFIRSNGSKFNLQKLFGLQHASGEEPKFTFGKNPGIKAEKANKDVDKARDVIVGQADVLSEQDTFGVGKFAILRRSTAHPYVTLKKGGAAGGLLGPPTLPFYTWTRGDAIVKITKAEDRPGAPDVDTSKGEEYVMKKPYQYRVEFQNPKDPANPHDKADFEMIVLASDMKVITTEAEPIENKLNDLKEAADAGEFFDPEKNSIMKAYESTRGRGLAGFISSLDFDYTDATYETGSITRRAPKMVKVSISFVPIHDIAPGMDSQGGMRAPLYPVGDISAHLAGDELANVEEYGVKSSKAQESFKETQGSLGRRQDE
tara:strand:+ start:16636 stop:19872 length:3237 start_codon:yes stop_codon:yes gene_type:complete